VIPRGSFAVRQLLLVPETYPGRTIAALTLLFFMAYSSSLIWLAKPDGRIVLGDALHHYVQLRSVVFDHDLRFTNEYVRLYGLRGGETGTDWVYGSTPMGYVRNRMPIGPAIIWAPLFLLVTSAVWIARLLGSGYPLDGYGRLFQASAGLTGVLASGLGSWAAYRAAALLFERRAAVWSVVTLWLSSSTIYYSVVSPTYSHAPSMLAVGVFWLVWVRTLAMQSVARYGALGALCGIAALMRWQDALLILVPLVDAVWHRRELGMARCAGSVGAYAMMALIAFTPQMYVWATLYGAPLAIPQGEGFLQWRQPALMSVLFSDYHGLFSWTPIVVLSVVGLVPLLLRVPLVGTAASLFLLTSWYVNAAAADWWAGEAFGARRFISCFPVFVLGLGALLHHVRASASGCAKTAAVFIGLTFLLLVQYQTFMHGLREIAPYPGGYVGLWLARFRVPFDLAAWWFRQ
jgi:hypothetical protein